MKPNELMIGDWVVYDDDVKYIDPIRIEGIDITGLCITSDRDDVGFEGVKPIPLTAEILEKNGFVKYNEVSDTPPYDKDEEGNMYYSYKGEHKFWGWWQPDNIYFIPANAMGNIEIKFVHQLQHALRLCNIEKEIEL